MSAYSTGRNRHSSCGDKTRLESKQINTNTHKYSQTQFQFVCYPTLSSKETFNNPTIVQLKLHRSHYISEARWSNIEGKQDYSLLLRGNDFDTEVCRYVLLACTLASCRASSILGPHYTWAVSYNFVVKFRTISLKSTQNSRPFRKMLLAIWSHTITAGKRLKFRERQSH